MKAMTFAISAVALLAFSADAESTQGAVLNLSGGQFLSLCADPPPDRGAQVTAMCRMYVAGIADDLQAAHLACFGPRSGPEKLFNTSMWWIQSRPREGFAAGLMIRTGLMRAFPCRVAMNRRAQPATPMDQSFDRFGKFVRFVKDAAELMAIFGIK